MKRFLGFLLLSVIMVGCFAQGKVKGELRTESNGFQWYCYKGKEAYTIEGVRLFPDIKASKIEYVLSKGYYKEKDKGCFRVKIDKYINVDVGDHKSRIRVCNIYSSNGKLIKEGVLGGSRYGIGPIENPVFYLCIMCGPFSFRYHGINEDGTKQYVAEGHILIIDDNGTIIESNLKQRNETLEQVTVLTEGKYEETKEVLGLWYRTNSNTTCLITQKGGKIELNGVWSFSLENSILFAHNEGTKTQKLFLLDCTYIGDLEKSEDSFYMLKKEGFVGVINKNGEWIIPLSSKYSEIQNVGEQFFIVKSSGYFGILSRDGKEIIPTSRGYTSIGDYDANKGTFAFTKKGYKGICNAQGKEISLTKIPPTLDEIKSSGGYDYAFEMMNGSKKYYIVRKGVRFGLTDSEGKVIIPCEMEALESAGAGFLRFKLNGFYGIVNYAGKILIPTDRGYTKIGDYVSFTKRFAYEMDGWKGECNNLGVQVSKIKVNKTQQSVGSNSSSSKTSNDLATFDLKGNVKKCVKGIETREFDRNGKLIAGKNEKITYDTHGRIISILIGEDVLGGGFKYEYDNFGRVKVESMILSLFGDPVESRTQNYYDTNGRVVRCIVTTVGHTGESDETYSDYIVDSHGNWISRKKNGSSTETRTIEYY